MSKCPNNVVLRRFIPPPFCVPHLTASPAQWSRDIPAQAVRWRHYNVLDSAMEGPYGSRSRDDNSKSIIPDYNWHRNATQRVVKSASQKLKAEPSGRDGLTKGGYPSKMENLEASIVTTLSSKPNPVQYTQSGKDVRYSSGIIGELANNVECSTAPATTQDQIDIQGCSAHLRARARRRVLAAISRAQNQLRYQGRVIGVQSFRHDIKTRLNSMYPYLSIHREWTSAYSSLYTAKFRDKEWVPPKLLDLDEEAKALTQKLENSTEDSFQHAWSALSSSRKAFLWPRLALWLLHNSPTLTLDLLAATNSQPYPPFVMAADCLIYLYAFYYGKSSDRKYRSVISTCLDPERWPSTALSQRGVRLYLMLSDHEQVSRAFNLMREREAQITVGTVLCFMNRFTYFRDVDRAIEALALIPLLNQKGLTLDSEEVLRHCCKLLMLDMVQDEGGVRNFRILPKLLELGVRPNRDMMNVVLSNAFRTGDPQLGQDMLSYMKSQGFQFDSYTYLTLLSDAVARGDRQQLASVVQEINGQDELRSNPYITSKIFHAHFTFSAKRLDPTTDPADAFSSMLDVYGRLYELSPLKDLLLIPQSYVISGQGVNIKPPSVALYIMMATYLRCRRNTGRVYHIYRRFRELVMQGHATVASLAETDHICNEFLFAFRDSSQALRYCVKIVEDMLRPLPRRVVIKGSKSRLIVPAKPSVRTWTILLSAFIFNRLPLAAERVKEMMAKYNIEYNDVTWNVIINGYANAQKAPETAATIKMMEAHGHSIDVYTLKCLRYLKDPERLRVAIEELDQKAAEQGQSVQLEERNERLLEEGLRRLAAKTKGES